MKNKVQSLKKANAELEMIFRRINEIKSKPAKENSKATSGNC